jgi:leucyl aminopeptidase
VSLDLSVTKRAPEGVAAFGVGVFSDDLRAGATELPVDRAVLEALGFEGKAGEVRVVPADERTTAVVGLGPRAEARVATYRRAAAALARAWWRAPAAATTLLDDVPEALDTASVAQAVAEGLNLGSYRFAKYKGDPKVSKLGEVALVGPASARVRAAVERGGIVADAVCLVRDLSNEPGGTLTPTAFADAATAVAERAGLDIRVLDAKAISKERLGGLLGVNRGSTEPPRLVELRWEPASPRGTVALVGKGITFDSGGLSLKASDGMIGMKSDMGGAGAVLGAMSVVPELAPKVRVLAFLPLTDNMPGGDATRVGDVLTIRNGKTVEVLNTDAEGRLVLADGLSLATEEKPDAIVDLATLTGACMVALGDRTAGLMGNHQGWTDQVRAAADAAGEPVWPLPLPQHLRAAIDSDIADLKNVSSGRYGGALVAGVFLREFVGDGIPWAHLDIAGPAECREDDPELGKGATGFGVRTLVELLSTFRKPKRADR